MAELSEHLCPSCGKQMLVHRSRLGEFLGCSGFPECQTRVLDKASAPIPTDAPSPETCNTCGSQMLIRQGRYGGYLACSAPNCKEQRKIVKSIGVNCPRAGCQGQIVEKKTSKGVLFYGCSDLVKNQCPSAYKYPPLLSGGPDGTNLCPKCKNLLVYKKSKSGDRIVCATLACKLSIKASGAEVHA